MNDKSRIIGGLATGVLIGLLAGAVAALLAAPQPGQQTRAMIRDRASNTVRETRSRAGAVLSEVKVRSQEIKGRIQPRNGRQMALEVLAE